MDKKTVLGIDLGTSNCAISLNRDGKCDVLPVVQLEGANRVGESNGFASVVYVQSEKQFNDSDITLPWNDSAEPYILGNFAREIGAQTPDRLITSAKSWLCSTVVDPKESVLPWNSSVVKDKMSPLRVTELYLRQLRTSIIHTEGKEVLDNSDVVLTVPASFDEGSRKITQQAAINAGFSENVTLLEEPLAAFYAWLDHVGDKWREKVKPGDVILVCDVGGGTSDFSLIAVTEHEGNLELKRISVGKHILLGGDNMDLALAYTLRFQLEEKNKKIDDWQFAALIHGCRSAKEKLFSDSSLPAVSISIPSRGSSLFAKTITVELTRETLQSVVVDGFFQETVITSVPEQNGGQGLQEFGLPYAQDPIISKHIAQFLGMSYKNIKSDDSLMEAVKNNVVNGEFIVPNAVLFNGGVFNAEPLRNRVVSLVNSWSNSHSVVELIGPDLDLAVSKGAATYGFNKRYDRGIRVRAGVAQSYYIGLEASMPAIPGFKPPVKALCVIQQGMEEGSESVFEEKEFCIIAGKSAEFRFFSSAQRGDDHIGAEVKDAEKELVENCKLTLDITNIDGSDEQTAIPVKLHAKLTELGTLELWMQHTKSHKKWELSFDIREG